MSPVESLLTLGAPQWSPSLHQMPPAKSLLTSDVHSQRSPSLPQVSPASGVPPYIRCPLGCGL
ncbi:hypothetical protein AB205_0219430, partial [Aquarana catesbeiana]